MPPSDQCALPERRGRRALAGRGDVPLGAQLAGRRRAVSRARYAQGARQKVRIHHHPGGGAHQCGAGQSARRQRTLQGGVDGAQRAARPRRPLQRHRQQD